MFKCSSKHVFYLEKKKTLPLSFGISVFFVRFSRLTDQIQCPVSNISCPSPNKQDSSEHLASVLLGEDELNSHCYVSAWCSHTLGNTHLTLCKIWRLSKKLLSHYWFLKRFLLKVFNAWIFPRISSCSHQSFHHTYFFIFSYIFVPPDTFVHMRCFFLKNSGFLIPVL